MIRDIIKYLIFIIDYNNTSKSDYDYIFEKKLFCHWNLYISLSNFKEIASSKNKNVDSGCSDYDRAIEFLLKVEESNLPISIQKLQWFNVYQAGSKYAILSDIIVRLGWNIPTFHSKL